MAITRSTARAATDQRRPQILAAATKLFCKKGFHATSMDEVARALNLNKATIYHHFPGGKSDLLYGIDVAAMDDLSERIAQHPADMRPEERVRRLVGDMVATASAHRDATIVYYEESRWLKHWLPARQYKEIRAREQEFRQLLVDALEEGVADGVFQSCPSEFVASYIIRSIQAAGATFGMLPDSDPALVGSTISDLFLRGLKA